MKKTRLLLAVLLLFAFNCTKDESDIKEALKNTIWIDAKTGTDTLRFTDSMMYRGPKDYSGQQVLLCGQPYRYIYSYYIKQDMLFLDWKGAEEIAFIKPFEYKVEIINNTLIINNFINCYYPSEKFQSDTFNLLKP
jgi:hypothetical protein